MTILFSNKTNQGVIEKVVDSVIKISSSPGGQKCPVTMKEVNLYSTTVRAHTNTQTTYKPCGT